MYSVLGKNLLNKVGRPHWKEKLSCIKNNKNEVKCLNCEKLLKSDLFFIGFQHVKPTISYIMLTPEFPAETTAVLISWSHLLDSSAPSSSYCCEIRLFLSLCQACSCCCCTSLHIHQLLHHHTPLGLSSHQPPATMAELDEGIYFAAVAHRADCP